MDRYHVSATVDGVEFKKRIMASSEQEALAMCENHLRWIYPTKNIEMGEATKQTNPARKRLKGKWPDEN